MSSNDVCTMMLQRLVYRLIGNACFVHVRLLDSKSWYVTTEYEAWQILKVWLKKCCILKSKMCILTSGGS